MKKELGGERLGNDHKMDVEIKEYDMSNQNLSMIVRTTMSAGTVVPVFVKVATPGDKWKIKCNMDVKTHPTVGPLFGSYKAEVQFWKAAVRLYQAEMYTDAVDQGLSMETVKLPQMSFFAQSINGTNDRDNSQVNPSCVLKYLGISGIGMITDDTPRDRAFNAISLLMLWDIYKNYLANKQEKLGAVIHTPGEDLVTTVDEINIVTGGNPPVELPEAPASTAITMNPATGTSQIIISYTGAEPIASQIIINVLGLGLRTLDAIANSYGGGAGTAVYAYNNSLGTIIVDNWRYKSAADIVPGKPQVATFPLENIDEMRRAILANIGAPGSVFSLNSQTIYPYSWLFEQGGDIPNILQTQEGLPVKTYGSDLFNNWLNTAWISGAGGINAITAIDTTGNTFQIPQFILKKKIYDMLNNVAVSGGSIVDWQEANWGKKPKAKATRPEYEGGLIREIVFQEVVSNSATEGSEGTQPLGTLAGKGIMGHKRVGGFIDCEIDEISYIIGLAMITPKIDYSQGNEWDIHLKTMDDFHKPAMDQIGFQDLIQERMAWWSTEYDTDHWEQKSTGKQPAWMEYRTSVNKTFGNFAVPSSEMFMTLNRRYEWDETLGIKDMTTYIDPVKYNNIFAYTALDAQNFWVQIAFDVEVRRKLTDRIMPNL